MNKHVSSQGLRSTDVIHRSFECSLSESIVGDQRWYRKTPHMKANSSENDENISYQRAI